MNLLELDNVTVVRGGHKALDRISLEIPIGRSTAVLGPNGSGKSTLLKLITRELYASSGNISILGQRRWEVADLRTQLGIVTRDLESALLSCKESTGLEAVLSGFYGSYSIFHHHSVTPKMAEQAQNLLSQMGAGHFCNKQIQQMSTGELRRVLIARALVPNPHSLILDEPSTGLDVVATRSLLKRLSSLSEAHTTLVIVTHHLEEIIPSIEWIILLKEGRLFAEGPKNEILRNDTLGQVFGGKLKLSNEHGYYSAKVEM